MAKKIAANNEKITSLAANWELSGKESVYQTIKTLKVCNDVLLKDAGVAPHGHSDKPKFYLLPFLPCLLMFYKSYFMFYIT